MQEDFRKWIILIGTGLSVLLIGLDFSIVNVALVTIQTAFNINLSELEWIMAGFGLSFCTMQISMGRLGDVAGRRLLLYVGVIGFGISSLGAGLSQFTLELIFFRILQGAFSAIIFPNGLALTSNAFPKSEQGKAVGLYTSVLGVGFAIGPVLGGLLISLVSWRWIFLINLPIVVASLLICYFSLNESHIQSKIRIDWWGMIFVCLSLGTVVFAFTQGPYLGWTSIYILASIITAIVSGIVFVIIEKKINEPLIPFHLLRNRGFLMGTLIFTLSIGFSWTVAFFTPLYLLTVLDYTPRQTGFMFLIITLMTIIVPGIAGGLYDRKGRALSAFLVCGMAIMSYSAMLFFQVNGPISLIVFAFLAYGGAWGAANGIAVPICLSEHYSSKDAGLISGTASTLLNIFGILIFSIMGILFTYIENKHTLSNVSKIYRNLTPNQIQALERYISNSEQNSVLIRNFLPHSVQEIEFYFKQSFMYAFHIMALIMLVITMICGLVILFMLKKPIHES